MLRLPRTRVCCAFLLALGSAASAALAQSDSTGTIRGTVQSSRGEMLANALITVAGQPRSASSDASGRFRIVGMASGTITLRVRYLGHRPFEQTLIVPSGGTVDVALRLEVVPFNLRAVRTQAAGDRGRFDHTADVGQVSFSGTTLANLPSIGEPDVLRAVQLLPGVVARNDFTAGYNVRGGESDQNLILLDGIPVYNPFHLGGLFGTFIDETVADVNLQSGGFAATYGGRLSSVLDVTSNNESRQGVHGSAAVSLLAASASLGGALPSGLTSWNIAGRRTYADKVARAFTDDVVPYYFEDAQLHVIHQWPGGAALGITGYAGKDVLDGNVAQIGDSSQAGGGDFFYDWGNRLVGATLTVPLGIHPRLPTGQHTSTYLGDSAVFVQRASYSTFATTLDLGSGSFVLRNSVAETQVSGSLRWFPEPHERTLGYEVAGYHVAYDAHSDETESRLMRFKQVPWSMAAYYDDLWKASGRLLVRLGLRGEVIRSANFWSQAAGKTIFTGFEPRASAKYFLTKDLALTLAGGRYAQWIHALRDEDVPVRIFDYWVASDSRIPVSTAEHAVLGAERWFGASRFVRLESYYKRYHDLIEANETQVPDAAGDQFDNVEGSAYGIDLLVRQLESRALSGWMAYSYSVSARAQNGSRYWPAHDRRHNVNLVTEYHRPGSRYTYAARFGYGSGTPYTNVVGQMIRHAYDGVGHYDAGDVGRDIQPVLGDRNGARYPSFQRLDLSVSSMFRPRWGTIAPYLQIVNAYNRKNVFVYEFNYTANPPTRSAVSQFPLLPTVGVTVHF